MVNHIRAFSRCSLSIASYSLHCLAADHSFIIAQALHAVPPHLSFLMDPSVATITCDSISSKKLLISTEFTCSALSLHLLLSAHFRSGISPSTSAEVISLINSRDVLISTSCPDSMAHGCTVQSLFCISSSL